MGRSLKVGLDYFRLDCNLDMKFQLIEAEFGLKGFAVVVKLYQLIYGELGYYCEWNEDVALMFSDRVRLGVSAVSEIIAASIKRKLFDKDLYDKYHILTSAGIQKWYFDSVSRRDKVEAIQEYLLVDVCSLPKNVRINSISVDINPFSVSRNAHSTVQNSKEDDEEETRAREEVDPWVRFIRDYGDNIGMFPTGSAPRGDMEMYFDEFGADVLHEVIAFTARHYPDNPKNYFDRLCRNMLGKGIKTTEQVKAAFADFERSRRNGRRWKAQSTTYAQPEDFY